MTTAAAVVGAPDPRLRRARFATAMLFLVNGALYASLVPHFPHIKAELGLGNALYGVAVAAFPCGALLVGPSAAALMRRFGSATVAVGATALLGVAVAAAAVGGTAVTLTAAFFVCGAADAVTDVAQNDQGLRVQRGYGRSVINTFHALWSAGCVCAGALASVFIAWQVPRVVHVGTAVVVLVGAGLAVRPLLLARDDAGDASPGTVPGHPADAARPGATRGVAARSVLMVLALAGLGLSGMLVEDAGSTWGGVYLQGTLGAPGAWAGGAFVAMVAAQFVGRLLADRLVDRFGRRAVVLAGGVATALGTGIMLAAPSVPVTLLGFAVAGAGCAPVVPAAMQRADELPGLKASTGLTVASLLMRAGGLVSPPLVGLVADTAGLRAGLLVLPLAGCATALLAFTLPRRHAPAAPGPAPASQPDPVPSVPPRAG